MRALVVDDSTLFRSVVRSALGELGVEVVGVAADGEQALRKIKEFQPDFITLDLEMPNLDGLGVLARLEQEPQSPKVVVVSALTSTGAEATNRALQLGAFDFILKPSETSIDANRAALRHSLAPMIAGIKLASKSAVTKPSLTETPKATSPRSFGSILPPKAIVIGVSTGGPAALAQLLPKLPADLPIPIVIVQHMPPRFTQSLAEQLDRSCELSVVEGKNGQPCKRGEVYIAPGGFQMGIKSLNGSLRLYVTDDPPEGNCKPAVDYLFRSAADALGDRCLAIILTGMGDDGLEGCKVLKPKGAKIIAQDQNSCIVYGMPRQIVDHSLADVVLPLDEIAVEILQAVHCEVAACQ